MIYKDIMLKSVHLLSILPSGVVSKKDMGLRRLLVRSRSWRRLAASIHPNAIAPDRINTPRAANRKTIVTDDNGY